MNRSNNDAVLLKVEDLTAPVLSEEDSNDADNRTSRASPLWSNVSLSISPGDILVIQGPSGGGKSVLLKCLAHLLRYPSGRVYLHGKTPEQISIPVYRSKVLYLAQRPALLPGTPREFFQEVSNFGSRKGRKHELGDPIRIARAWNIQQDKWDQTWGQLSGGEGQRIALAIGLALKPEVLLLDGTVKLVVFALANIAVLQSRLPPSIPTRLAWSNRPLRGRAK